MTNTFDIIPTKKKVDISEFKESLGNLIASYVFLPGPVYRLRMVEGMYGLIFSMLVANGRYSRLEKDMNSIKQKYKNAVEAYSTDDGWRDTQKLCFDCESELYRIAITEDLVKLNPSMFIIGGSDSETVGEDGGVIRR